MSESIEDKIAQLVDMGFSPEQASKALKATNNDVENAIGYLFEEPIEVESKPPLPSRHNDQDTIQVSNPLDIPDFSALQAYRTEQEVNETDSEQTPDELDINELHVVNERQLKGEEDDEDEEEEGYDKDHPMEDSVSKNLSPSDSDDESIDDNVSLFDKVKTYEFDSSIPKLIIPSNPLQKENYFIPFIIILSQITKFQSIVFDKQFENKDYGWDKNWFNEGILNLLIPTDINKEQVPSFKFVVELQRLVGFIAKNDSKRLLISDKNFYQTLPKEFKNLLNDTLLIEEIIPKIFEILKENILKTINQKDIEIAKRFKELLDEIFTFEVVNEEEDQKNDVCHIDIESNLHHANLYESFNELVWGNELEQLGQIMFSQLADVLTVSRIGDDQYNSYYGNQSNSKFEILEEFYPEIYSSEYVGTIVEMNKLRESLFSEKVELVKRINHMNFFEGKKLEKILDKTSLILEGESKLDIDNFRQVLEGKKSFVNEEIEKIGQQFKESDITVPENVIKRIENEGHSLKPYIITGIIHSNTEYCYRKRGSKQWVSVKYIVKNSKEVVDAECQVFDSFEDLKPRLHTNGTQTCVYVKGEIWNDLTCTPSTPHGLSVFFGRDNSVMDENVRREKGEDNGEDGKEEGEEEEEEMEENNEEIKEEGNKDEEKKNEVKNNEDKKEEVDQVKEQLEDKDLIQLDDPIKE
ncbi:hypothetical protein CAAN1_10S02762 [[Candida] anglica]|uniref:UBA domain-containing protein n=1 Tax=[Candida] anglica TaxID=148631 RepID=A0ABP0EEH2_9ASCO